MTPPVVFLVFNRPDLTARSFAAVRAARPARLHVVADGPRATRPGEADLCAATRAVTERVDWPCEVTRDYSDVNLGCGRRISSGITGAFRLFDAAVILEDDCLPHPSFFRYCGELLDRYRDDERVMHVGGLNCQDGRRRGPGSYYFSKFTHVWGWATWRRAWDLYDFALAGWPAFRDGGELAALCVDDSEAAFWDEECGRVTAGTLDTWDVQWLATCWMHGGLAATPQVNLVTNVGNRPDGTHTRGERNPYAGLAAFDVGDIAHPDGVTRDGDADRYTYDLAFDGAARRRAAALPRRLRRAALAPVRWAYRLVRPRPAA